MCGCCVEMQTRGLFELKSCAGLTVSLVLWVCYYYYYRETLADILRQKGKKPPRRGCSGPRVSLRMHIPGPCAGGILEKTEEMNFPVPKERCQTDAYWDRSHTYHIQNISPRNETHLGSNSHCAWGHLSLSDRWVWHVYVSVQRHKVPKRTYLPSLSICTMYYVQQQVPQERAESHVHVIDRDYGMASCWVWTWNPKQMLPGRIHKTVIPECIHSSAAQPARNIPLKPGKQEMKKVQRGWMCFFQVETLKELGLDLYSTCT